MGHSHSFQVGDRVVVRICKHGTHPGPRARHVRPEQAGEGYQYEVEKFWSVCEVRGEQVVLLTRRGKLRIADVDDPAIRRARWWQRIIYRNRFPDSVRSLVGLKA